MTKEQRQPPRKAERAPTAAPRFGAVSVGAYVPRIAGAVFESHGFPSAAIIADWPAIAGSELAAFTLPERLIWPRRRDDEDAEEAAAGRSGRHRRRGATLVLRVDGPRALEVQHSTHQLIERVNIYFGYGAVAQIRIIQAPVRRGNRPQIGQEQPLKECACPDPALDSIADEGLRTALSRLSARVGDPRR